MLDDQLAVAGQVDIDHLYVRLLSPDFIFPRQRSPDTTITALVVNGIHPQFRVSLLVEYLEQAPLAYQMRAEKLRNEAFIAVIGPNVLEHLHGVARPGDVAEPF